MGNPLMTAHSTPDRAEHPVIPGLEDDDVGSRIVAEELRLLATVYLALDHAEAKQSNAAAGRDLDEGRMLELRDEVSTAKPEDLPALFEQMHNLAALRAQRGKGAVGAIDRGSPYFGHIRLEETYPGEKKPRRRDVLVGGRSYVDSTAGIRIVDWRHAPVSRIFYRYREEDDYEEMLGNKLVEGNILARRSVSIQKGVLRRVSAPQGTFVLQDSGKWSRVDVRASQFVVRGPEDRPQLGVGADGKARNDKVLPAIASMLDSAQFELITKPGAGVVAIQGSAGSGKTTVGLHRIAYLHSIDATRFRPDRMLVIVPTEALIHYTSRVLPDLGVEGVPVMTFQRWAVRVMLDLYPKLPSRISDETPGVVVRMKTHGNMLRAIDELVARTETEIDERIRTQMPKWEGGQKVIDAWSRTTGKPDERVSELSSWIAGKRTIAGAAAPNTIPEVTKGALAQLGAELRKKSRGVFDLWDELCTNMPLLERTFKGPNGESLTGFGPGQLKQAHEWCTLQTRIRQEHDRDGDTPSLDAEDYSLILRIFQALRGPLVDGEGNLMRVAHLFVDEVQDASPIELRILMDLTGKDKCVTLSGDLAQRMLEDDDDRGEFHWSDLLDALELPTSGDGMMEPLKVSYRSTAQITKFAREVLGPHAHEAEPIADRHGPPVELFPFSSPGEAVAFLADALRDLHRVAPTANVAVLARFGPQADVYYEGLERAEVPNVRRVRKQDFSWEPGVDVTDVRQTKGLEWDEVVLVDVNRASYPDSSQARHAMYVGATRAAHQLWCVTSEEPSPIAKGAVGYAQATTGAAAGHQPASPDNPPPAQDATDAAGTTRGEPT